MRADSLGSMAETGGIRLSENNAIATDSFVRHLGVDPSWMCVLCLRGGHETDLGSLFGPYSWTGPSPSYIFDAMKAMALKLKRRRVLNSSYDAIKTFGLASARPTETDCQREERMRNPKTLSEIELQHLIERSSREFWIHEECACYTPGVMLNSHGELKHLEVSMENAYRRKCWTCGAPGATVPCEHRACRRTFHLPCIVRMGGELRHETFSISCHRHAMDTR